MTRDVVTVTEDASLEEVARLMERHRIRELPFPEYKPEGGAA